MCSPLAGRDTIPRTLKDLASFHEKNKCKSQKNILKVLEATDLEVLWSRLDDDGDVDQRAQCVSAQQAGATAFLRAVPVSRGLTFEDEEFRVALCLFMRLPTHLFDDAEERGMECPACLQAGAMVNDYHAHAGPHRRVTRHDAVVSTVAGILATLGANVVVEPRGLVQANKGVDLLITRMPPSNERLQLDVTTAFVSAPTYANKASRTPLHASRAAAAIKHKKYHREVRALDAPLLVLCIESGGAFGPGLQKLLKMVGTASLTWTRGSPATLRSVFPSYWCTANYRTYATQAISVSYWLHTARKVLVFADRIRRGLDPTEDADFQDWTEGGGNDVEGQLERGGGAGTAAMPPSS